MIRNNWKKYERGDGIRVKLPNDFDEKGKQKYRPGIVIRSYPNHIKVQLFSTDSKNAYTSILINEKIQYIKPKYNCSITINEVNQRWNEKETKSPIKISRNNNLFKKIAEMEYWEISGQKYRNTNFKERIDQLIEWIKDLEKENSKLKLKIKSSK